MASSNPIPLRPRHDAPPRVFPEPPSTVPVLGMPLALTDYERTMDWMDGMVAAGARGLRLRRRRPHASWPAQEDPELRDAVLGSTLTVPDGQPLVWALQRARPRHSPTASTARS